MADDEGRFWDGAEAGGWEPGLWAILDRLAGPGALVIDLGAWVGPVSLYAAALGAEVVAVEADPAALRDLRLNVDANAGLAHRITIVPRAVAPRPGAVRLGARRKQGDSMSSTLLPGAAETWTVEAVAPAELARMIAGEARLLIKLDIEGGEYAVLPELGPLLDRPGAACLVSLHPDILRAAGEPEPYEAAAAALAIFAGWRAHVVEEGGLRATDVTSAELARSDQWLFER